MATMTDAQRTAGQEKLLQDLKKREEEVREKNKNNPCGAFREARSNKLAATSKAAYALRADTALDLKDDALLAIYKMFGYKGCEPSLVPVIAVVFVIVMLVVLRPYITMFSGRGPRDYPRRPNW